MKKPKIVESINRFLSNPKKPIILALCRPDPKKNILSLVRAYGDNRKLRDTTNLVLVLGIREDIKKMEKTTRELFNEIFYLMDNYDLYGSLAVPKQHEPDDVPEIYRMAARAKGVFVNPAVTEPFGLTLIEAASSGLPVVATKHGGAKEIVEKCKNGLLVDPQNTAGIADTILDALSDKARWNRWARSGLVNAYRHYSWRGHVNKYIKVAKKVINQHEKKWGIGPTFKKRIITADRMLVCDIDNTLIGDKESLFRLINLLDEAGEGVSFGIATGRNLKLSLGGLKDWDIPVPNFLITSVGSEIFYGPRLVRDLGWEHHINYRWKRDVIREVIHGLPGIKPQGPKGQGDFKVSFFIDPAKAPKIPEISRMLRKAGIRAKVIFSHGQYLDIIPLRASKGLAVRHLAVKWGIPVERILVAGDSGNDEDMLMGNTLGVVVASHSSELDRLRGQPNIYFANASYAAGIIEAIEHYDFFGTMYPIGKEIGQNE